MVQIYNEDYYHNMDGVNPYIWDNRVWRSFFSHVAEQVVNNFKPETSLDIGCAIGFLVDEMRKRGVRAKGIDGSAYAVGVAQSNGLMGSVWWCDLLNFPKALMMPHYDFVSCIEVVEHIAPAFADQAVHVISSVAKDTILFSSSPDDFAEPTHVNVQPEGYWLRKFNGHGFLKTGMAPWLSKQAIILKRKTL